MSYIAVHNSEELGDQLGDKRIGAKRRAYSVWYRLALCLFALLLAPRAESQTNPTPEACGLPASGTIWTSATYTLTADCAQSGQLLLPNPATTNPPITLTIEGGGHTVRLGNGNFGFIGAGHARNNVVLRDITVDGGHVSRIGGLVEVSGSIDAQRVTLRRSKQGPALHLSSSASATLNNVLLEDNLLDALSATGNGVAINMSSTASATLTDVVFRNNRFGNLRARSDNTVTTNGCLSFAGNLPYDVVIDDPNDWTDNSTGRCTGTIGNKGNAVSPITMHACGFPQSGFLVDSRTYSLRSNCSGVGRVVLSDVVSITVNGNGYQIAGSTDVATDFDIAGNGKLTINNATMENTIMRVYGALEMNNATYQNTAGLGIGDYGSSVFRKSIFQNNASTQHASVYLSLPNLNQGKGTFTDTIFRNNSGGNAVLWAYGSTASITLNGCVTFEGNAVADTLASNGATINDNSTGTCASEMIGVIGRPANTRSNPHNNPHNHPRGNKDCFQPLGAIGLICRQTEPELGIQIWGVTRQSEGFFILYLPQTQLDAAASQGLIASSADGRVGVRLIGPSCVRRNEQGDDPRVVSAECIGWELTRPGGSPIGGERYVLVSMGPNNEIENKTHSVVFDNSLAGHVIGAVDTLAGVPGIPAVGRAPEATPEANIRYAPTVQRQPPRPDGSLVHVVQAGDTVWTIAVAYKTMPWFIIDDNHLGNGGRNIHPGQELAIRKAA